MSHLWLNRVQSLNQQYNFNFMKVSFLDFWDGFDQNNNFFLHSLRQIIEVEVVSPEESELIIFSCFGYNNFNYLNKKRIFYTGENLRPNFESLIPIQQRQYYVGKSDFAFTFDFSEDPRNIRVPLWMLQIDWFGKKNYTNPQFTIEPDLVDDNEYSRKPKTKFCSIMFNSPSPYRYEIVDMLSTYKQVDVYGNRHNNVGYGEDKKLEVISDYKFNICFENTIQPGYYTEKPLHAKVAGCVPIYWSEEQMGVDFNKRGFVNLYDFSNNLVELCNYIVRLDQDDDLFETIRRQPTFNDNQNPKVRFESFLQKLKEII